MTADLLTSAAAGADRAAELLERLVGIESPSGDREGIAEVTEVLGAALRRCGMAVTSAASLVGAQLRADLPGSPGLEHAAPVVLVGHTDTVWPLGTLAQMPWFVEEGVAHGPGCYDMKSGLVVMVEACRLLADLPHPPVRVLAVPDEEVGTPVSREWLMASAAGARAVLGFESPHPDGALKVGRLGSMRVQIEVKGKASHAALAPQDGVSAIDELVDLLVGLRTAVAGIERDNPGGVLCNVGVIAGGTATNVVPARASASVGLRFRTPEVDARLTQLLDAMAPLRPGAEVQIDRLSHRPAWLAGPADQALDALASRTAGELGLPVLAGRPAAGAGDANLLGAAGLPTIDGLGPRGAGAHARSEQVCLTAIPGRAALTAGLISALGQH